MEPAFSLSLPQDALLPATVPLSPNAVTVADGADGLSARRGDEVTSTYKGTGGGKLVAVQPLSILLNEYNQLAFHIGGIGVRYNIPF